MKILLIATLLLSFFQITAYWTGRQWQVKTVTGKYVWKCEYRYNRDLYYKLFEDSCAQSIKIY